MGVKMLKKYTFLDFLSWGTIIPLKFQNATCSAASYFVKMCWTYAQRHKDDLTPHV
jgi:aromatic ring-opening dioxygenase LigB subunit